MEGRGLGVCQGTNPASEGTEENQNKSQSIPRCDNRCRGFQNMKQER